MISDFFNRLYYGRDAFVRQLMQQRDAALEQSARTRRLLERSIRFIPGYPGGEIERIERETFANDRIVDLINEIRREEGATLTLVCDNPAFHGPDCYITVANEATRWQDKRYEGCSLLHCLENAAAELRMVRAAEVAR